VSAEVTRLAGLADDLRRLHQGPILVLPNVWDVGSARVVDGAGFPALATTSAAIAATLGFPDGEGAPWQEMFAANERIARAVSIPVSMDAEGGYGLSPAALVEQLLRIGVVGCNLEDTDHRRGGLQDAEQHAAWLSAVRKAADDSGVPIVINARVDVFLPAGRVQADHRVGEALRRGRLYRDAGADCIYPIGMTDAEAFSAVVDGLACPVNANAGPALDLDRLRALGVARVSYGPQFYRALLADFDTAVRTLSVEASVP
jgi:2-methylisocitrate lyase-like PEP mutase family enzyme